MPEGKPSHAEMIAAVNALIPICLGIAAIAGVWTTNPAFKVVSCIIIGMSAIGWALR